MVETAVIIPLLILGVLIGSILRNTNVKINKRVIFFGSFFSGVGNVIYTAVLSFFQNKVASGSISSPSIAFQTNSSELLSSLLFSFLVGIFIILIVFALAALTLKIRGRTIF
jgi:hypothetical protein